MVAKPRSGISEAIMVGLGDAKVANGLRGSQFLCFGWEINSELRHSLTHWLKAELGPGFMVDDSF